MFLRFYKEDNENNKILFLFLLFSSQNFKNKKHIKKKK